MLNVSDPACRLSEADSEGGSTTTLAVGLEPSVFTPDELPLVAARVGLSGAYLALEATLTGSLWLAMATSAAGLTTMALLSRRSGAK
jgi:hypothetical protein